MQLKPFFKYTLFFGLFLSATLAFAQTDKQAELERQRRALMSQIEELSKLRQNNKQKEVNVLSQVEDLDSKIKAHNRVILLSNYYPPRYFVRLYSLILKNKKAFLQYLVKIM